MGHALRDIDCSALRRAATHVVGQWARTARNFPSIDLATPHLNDDAVDDRGKSEGPRPRRDVRRGDPGHWGRHDAPLDEAGLRMPVTARPGRTGERVQAQSLCDTGRAGRQPRAGHAAARLPAQHRSMFGGIEANADAVKRMCGANLPCVFVLHCDERMQTPPGDPGAGGAPTTTRAERVAVARPAFQGKLGEHADFSAPA